MGPRNEAGKAVPAEAEAETNFVKRYRRVKGALDEQVLP